MKELAIALVMLGACLGPGISIGLIGFSALKAMGRNPDAGAKIQTLAILCIAFAEAIAIYCLVVAILIGILF